MISMEMKKSSLLLSLIIFELVSAKNIHRFLLKQKADCHFQMVDLPIRILPGLFFLMLMGWLKLALQQAQPGATSLKNQSLQFFHLLIATISRMKIHLIPI